MNEREIFAAAMEKPTQAERLAFLAEVCDGEMRERMELLLEKQAHLGSFLDHPPVAELTSEGTDTDPGPAGAAATILQTVSSTGDLEPHMNRCGDRPIRSLEEDDEIPLGYLQPSSQPGSKGRLGHYEVLEVVGRGAFGTVLRAFDEKLHRVVAIKVLAPELASTSPARKRFLREARTSASIRHENVVAIHAVEDTPIPYLVMEFIPGKTLQQLLDQHGPLDLPHVLRIGKQIAFGLAAAHEKGLIHRDIKPGNILLEGAFDDRVKITDFGLARAADDASMTQSGLIAGTPMYMAPEQAHGHKLDQRADLFSLGSVLYQMICGRPPFRASTTLGVLKRVTEDTPRPIPEIIPETPAWLCELIGYLHAKNPAERYGSAQELGELLEHCERELQAGRVPTVSPPTCLSPTLATNAPDAPSLDPAASRAHSPASQPRRHSSLVMIAATVLTIFVVLSVTEAAGVTQVASTVIRLTVGSGTLVIETDDPGLKVAVDGKEVQIKGAGIEELTLRPGEYRVAATKDGKSVAQQLVTITRGGRQSVNISLEPPAEPIVKGLEYSNIAHLPATQQIRQVGDELRRLNPGFDGKLLTTIEKNQVVGLELRTEHVSDITPLRALHRLLSLACVADDTLGQVSDLSSLSNLPLTSLTLDGNSVHDLSPLHGMRLQMLSCERTNVADLAPLSGMPLHYLKLSGSKVRELSPLKGAPLEELSLDGTSVSDLSPLQGMPMRNLSIHATRSTSLESLRGMPLILFNCEATEVSDLTPLAGAPLQMLCITNTKVTDLNPLKGSRLEDIALGNVSVQDTSALRSLPLRKIWIDFEPSRDTTTLRNIKTLEIINEKPAQRFWEELDRQP